MAGDDGGETGGRGIEVELRQVVKHVNGVGADVDDVAGRKSASPSSLVVIPANGSKRREGSECIQDRWIAYITAMNDKVRAAERIEYLGPNQTVGIGDKTDAMKRTGHMVTKFSRVIRFATRGWARRSPNAGRFAA